ncbi:MAG: response regulator [Planctomycetota bacterium]
MELLRNALEHQGHEVVSAEGAEEALVALEKHEVRFVISDWEMPEVSGLDLYRRVPGEEIIGYVYFVLLTSHRGREAMIEGMEAGADDFLEKPFDPAELRMRVRAWQRIRRLLGRRAFRIFRSKRRRSLVGRRRRSSPNARSARRGHRHALLDSLVTS